MKRNEKTGKDVARIAATLLNRSNRSRHQVVYFGTLDIVKGTVEFDINPACLKEELQAICASALTQAADKPKRRAK